MVIEIIPFVLNHSYLAVSGYGIGLQCDGSIQEK